MPDATHGTQVLNKILDKHTVSRPLTSDSVQACLKCQCPVQCRPIEFAAWSCIDCDRPPNDAVTRFARILAEKPGGGAEWLTLRPRGDEVMAPAGNEPVDLGEWFESLPESMAPSVVSGYLRWMERILAG